MICKLYVAFFFACAFGKTIRSRIHTNENGTKELIFTNGSDVKQKDVDFLMKSLNLTDDVKVNVPGGGEEREITNESILMQHWNSLTEVGWKNFSHPLKKLYLNSTRVLRLAPEFKSNETKSIIDECETVQQEIDNVTAENGTVESEGNATPSEEGRTLRPRRFLHRILLPLLVVIVIKYLVTLPFVAVSVFTLNAMWLGLLSLGAVLFAKLKADKFPHRRLGPVAGNEYFEFGAPVAGSEIYWSPVRVPHSGVTTH